MKKKERVIEAAKTLFSKKGFDKTSMSEICDLANVSKGLVYHHFTSKDEILKEIFLLTTERMKGMNQLNLESSASSQLLALIESFFIHLENDKANFQLNLNMMFQPTSRALLQDELKQRSSMLLHSIKALFDEIDSKRSAVLSYILIAELDGIALDYLSVFEHYPLEEVKQELLLKYQRLNHD